MEYIMTFREVMKRLGIWSKAQNDTYKELSRLTDYELKDIGLSRADIIRLINEMEE
jgi:uncharacterized protein YjiS (DUF1127 family)